jgi:hypothetical protein
LKKCPACLARGRASLAGHFVDDNAMKCAVYFGCGTIRM